MTGNKNSDLDSFIDGLETFVQYNRPERNLDIQPFFFGDKGKFLPVSEVINKDSKYVKFIKYFFGLLEDNKSLSGKSEQKPEKYRIYLSYGIDTGRIRMKYLKIIKTTGGNRKIKLIEFNRNPKNQFLKIDLKYIMSSNYLDSGKDKYSNIIASEIIKLWEKGYAEKRRFDNNIYFPKTMMGVLRYFKYELDNYFYEKYGKDINSKKYKSAHKIIEGVQSEINNIIADIAKEIKFNFIEPGAINIKRNIFPEPIFKYDIFNKLFFDFIEDNHYDKELFNVIREIIIKFKLGEDLIIEGDLEKGCRIFVKRNGSKINLSNLTEYDKKLITLIMLILMNGRFNIAYKNTGKDEMKPFYYPVFNPIVIKIPESFIDKKKYRKLSEIICYFSQKINTPLIVAAYSDLLAKEFIRCAAKADLKNKYLRLYNF